MEDIDYQYHLENLMNSDPDYVVDVLGITSEELVEAFPKKAKAFILSEFNDG